MLHERPFFDEDISSSPLVLYDLNVKAPCHCSLCVVTADAK
jgi:hypothetical protein